MTYLQLLSDGHCGYYFDYTFLNHVSFETYTFGNYFPVKFPFYQNYLLIVPAIQLNLVATTNEKWSHQYLI